MQREGQPERHDGQTAALVVISDDYFRLMEIPRLTGRKFTAADREGSARVAIVSESIVRRYFGGEALGKRIILPEFLFNIDGGPEGKVEIVGVVGNVCVNSVEDCEPEHIYLPEGQSALRMENLLVRTEGAPLNLARAVRHTVYLAAPTIPLDDPKTLEQRASYLSDQPKRAMWLLGVFAGLALLLAAAGIYGVSAYLATQRRREIGIRMALGAEFADIAALIYRGTLQPSAIGLAAGIAGSLWLSRLLKSMLFGVGVGDPKTLTVSGLVLLATAAVAATGPAVRAALTDPARILHRD